MKKLTKNIYFIMLILAVCSFIPFKPYVIAQEKELNISCNSYILIDKDSGNPLISEKENERMPVASIVKLMTILITLENLEKQNFELTDKICVSENASGMGGSQIFLDANEEYEIGELLKSVIVCSANDSSVALAEHIAGSEQAFVKLMKQKASELGLNNTNYENSTGLPAPNQYSSAFDVAMVLKEVVDYPIYQEYSKIWLEDFVHPSGRKTEMTNTNKLSRFYNGCLGGKTGSTEEAKYCLSVCAKRDNLSLIAVVLGNTTSKERFNNASELLNYGFANYENKILFDENSLNEKEIKMQGQNEYMTLKPEKSVNIVHKKYGEIDVVYNYNLPSSLIKAKENDVLGYVDIIVNGEKYASVNILAKKTINEPTFSDYFKRIQDDFI